MKRLLGLAIGVVLLFSACNGTSTPSPTPPRPTATTDPLSAVVAHGDLKKGGTYWGVYVAVAKPGSQDLQFAQGALGAYGATAFPTPAKCDKGAAQKLNARSGDLLVAVYFASEDEANAFASELSPDPIGVYKVKVNC